MSDEFSRKFEVRKETSFGLAGQNGPKRFTRIGFSALIH